MKRGRSLRLSKVASFFRDTDAVLWLVSTAVDINLNSEHPSALAADCAPSGASEKPPALAGGTFIPGAGGAVYGALDVLELAVTQQNLPAAYARAEYCWNCWEQESAEHNKANAKRGRAQYEKLKEHFARRVKEWGTAADTSTRYRLQA